MRLAIAVLFVAMLIEAAPATACTVVDIDARPGEPTVDGEFVTLTIPGSDIPPVYVLREDFDEVDLAAVAAQPPPAWFRIVPRAEEAAPAWRTEVMATAIAALLAAMLLTVVAVRRRMTPVAV